MTARTLESQNWDAVFRNQFNTIFSDDEDENEDGRRDTFLPLMAGGFIDPVLTSTTYHVHQAETALLNLKQLMNDQDGWKKALRHKSGVVVHMKPGLHKGDKTPIFRGEATIIGFSPQSVFYVIGMRKLWDEQYEDGNLVENLNDTTSLTYEVSKGTPTSRPRDVSLVERIECTTDGAIIFACTSVETARVPRIQGRVRAQIKLQGWVLEAVRGTSTPATRVSYIIQENAKGWIPGFASKKSLARRPLVIALVNDYLQKKAERMRSSSNSTSLAAARRSSALIPSSMTSVNTPYMSPSKASSSTLTSSVYSASPTRPTSKKRITFADHDTTYSAEPYDEEPNEEQDESATNNINKTIHSSLQLYPPHRHPARKTESLELLKRLSSNLDDWSYKGERDSIKMYTLDSDPDFLRSDSVLESWTSEQLCSTVNCFGARKIWDEHRFEEGQVMERFSQKNYLVRWLLKGIFPVEGHDIAAITSIHTDKESGSIYVASASVIDAQVSFKSRKKRAHTELYGWVFTPTPRNARLSTGSTEQISAKEPLSVKVTMISQLFRTQDPAPPRVAHALVDETFGSIGRLRAYLNAYGCPPYVRRVAGKVLHEKFECIGTHYQLMFIAKHEPSTSSKRRKDRMWCTEVFVHPSAYRHGFDIAVSPAEGIRTEMVTDQCLRIFTTQEDMDGRHIRLDLRPNPSYQGRRDTEASCASSVTLPASQVSEVPSTASDLEISDHAISNPTDAEVPDTPPPSADFKKTTPTNRLKRPSSASFASSVTTQLVPPLSPTHAKDTHTLQVPKGYVLVPEQHHQAHTIINISDELTFNGQQLAVVFIAMVLSYYMGKFACVC